MKTMHPHGYHRNVFVVTHASEHMMYGCTLLVPANQGMLNMLSKKRYIEDHK